MSLMRLPLPPAVSAGRVCLRCFSSGPERQNNINSILSVLKDSPANRPAFSNSRQPAGEESLSMNLARQAARDLGAQMEELNESARKAQYQRQIFRKWQPGDVYAPRDLSGTEQKKWKTGRRKPTQDAFDVLGINPILEYKNFTMMSEYMTEMGRIKHSRDTGLRPKNQRKIAKAIRRAVGLGLMPSVHRHPLVMKRSHPARFM